MTAAQWFAFIVVLLAAAGAIWAYVEMGHGLSFTFAKRTPPPAAAGLISERRRLDAAINVTEFQRRPRTSLREQFESNADDPRRPQSRRW